MTNQHPITPPPELVREWNQEAAGTHFEPYGYSEFIANRAAKWGADLELEACCEWIRDQGYHPSVPRGLHADRRPKPPSLKEQALNEVVAAVAGGNITPERGATIRLALEQLPDNK
jgi:hypothetical protein